MSHSHNERSEATMPTSPPFSVTLSLALLAFRVPFRSPPLARALVSCLHRRIIAFSIFLRFGLIAVTKLHGNNSSLLSCATYCASFRSRSSQILLRYRLLLSFLLLILAALPCHLPQS
jgi:hypothetical protein